MPDYRWAVGKGKIVTADYDRRMTLSAAQVQEALRKALANLFDQVTIEPVDQEFKEVYRLTIGREERTETAYICGKGTTPGGRSNLQDEQRIQQKAKYLNYAYEKKSAGEKAVCLGVYQHESEPVFCAWNLSPSAASPETPISKQIKITTIARALSEGFARQMSGSGEYVCAFKSDFIYFYLANAGWIHTEPLSQLNAHHAKEVREEAEEKELPEPGKNILLYGVPGAGKSHVMDTLTVPERTERVVFHPDYTYADFIGQILPRVEGEQLKYIFSAGPFTRMLQKAYADPEKMYFLLIEEINRGNAPAIFGDVFQLLDRNEDGSGKYAIAHYDMAQAVFGDENRTIRLPANLTVLATMNTSDQNVFTLDTAFQRRWEMHLIKNKIAEAQHAQTLIEGSCVSWGNFALVTNEVILRFGEETGISEDKRLGAYFVKAEELKKDRFAEKVLKYLWDDAFKMDRYVYFREEMVSLEQMIEAFETAPARIDVLQRVLQAAVYEEMCRRTPEAGQADVPADEGNEDDESYAV